MVAASTTNHGKDICMMDENEVENCVSQKRPTMAQVIMRQKKAKVKLIIESKHSPFWLGFQAMNWTNRVLDYLVDSMELVNELIKKRMEIEEATECQQAIPSFPFVIQEEWPSKRDDGIEGQYFNLHQIPFNVEDGFALDYQIAICFEMGNLKLSKEVKERLK